MGTTDTRTVINEGQISFSFTNIRDDDGLILSVNRPCICFEPARFVTPDIFSGVSLGGMTLNVEPVVSQGRILLFSDQEQALSLEEPLFGHEGSNTAMTFFENAENAVGDLAAHFEVILNGLISSLRISDLLF